MVLWMSSLDMLPRRSVHAMSCTREYSRVNSVWNEWINYNWHRFIAFCYTSAKPSSGDHVGFWLAQRTRYIYRLAGRTNWEITHSLMELSPSSEVANCAATQELPNILWNPKVHYRVLESPVPSHINPIWLHSAPKSRRNGAGEIDRRRQKDGLTFKCGTTQRKRHREESNQEERGTRNLEKTDIRKVASAEPWKQKWDKKQRCETAGTTQEGIHQDF
jgi:hypothetical protein